MNKHDFMLQLRQRLQGLPKKGIEERLAFYSEMIDDRIEEGTTEEEAVVAAGSVEEIVAQIVAEIPLAKIARERIRSAGRLSGWAIALLAIGSPLWFSLLIAAFAVVFSVYISLWAVIVSLWAVFASLAACAPAGIAAGIGFICGGNTLSGLAMIAAGFICAALAIFAFFGCNAATHGTALLTKKFMVWLKNRFIKKEGVQ